MREPATTPAGLSVHDRFERLGHDLVKRELRVRLLIHLAYHCTEAHTHAGARIAHEARGRDDASEISHVVEVGAEGAWPGLRRG